MKKTIFKKTIIVTMILIFCFSLLPAFSLAESGLPGTMGEAKIFLIGVLKFIPSVIKEVWQGFLRLLSGFWNWLVNIWRNYIFPFFHRNWLKIRGFFEKEFQQRKPAVEEEYQKEKEEMKEEATSWFSKIKNSFLGKFWEKLKSLFKK